MIVFGGIPRHILPNGFVLHAEINKDILPSFPDPGVNVPIEPDTFWPEIAHLSVKPPDEFRRRDPRFLKTSFDDLF